MLPQQQHRFELYARLPQFRRKVARAQKTITDWLSKTRYPYIAFSTGKDSTCVANLVWEQAPHVPAVYFDADCAFPESAEMLERMQSQGRPLIKWPAAEPLLDTLSRMGLDSPKTGIETMRTTVWRPIKTLLEQHHFDGVALGLRADECYGRKKLAQVRGPLFWQERDQLWEALPVVYWTYDDIWAYIVSQKIEFCQAYDRMWYMPEEDQRLSYWAGETKRCWGRYAWLRQNYPELFNRLAQRLPEVRGYV